MKCGKQIGDNAKFCLYCGNKVADAKRNNITDTVKKITDTAMNTAKSAGNVVKESINNTIDNTDIEKNMEKETVSRKEQVHTEESKEATNNKSDYAVNRKNVIVSTGDLKQDYEIIGPVYFQVSNKGLFSSALSSLVKKYQKEIQEMKSANQLSQMRMDWGFLYGEWSVGQNEFDRAFFVSVQELKERAAMLGADAIICMRQDIDLDTNAFAYFYLQMYGTAVKFK